MDAAIRKLNELLFDAVHYLFEETAEGEESVTEMKKKLQKKLQSVESMTEDHMRVLKWHHQVLQSVTLQSAILELITHHVSLIHESLYFTDSTLSIAPSSVP